MKITKAAIVELERLKVPDSYVRVSVGGGGCSGLKYKLEFQTTEISKEDSLIELGAIKVVIDNKSAFLLYDAELDFQGGLNGKGFTFNNPNATRTCGCGKSFCA